MIIRLQLIPGWKRAYRLTSVQAAAALNFFSLLQSGVLPMLQDKLPPNPLWWVTFAISLAVIVFRVLSQPGVLDEPASGEQHEGPSA